MKPDLANWFKLWNPLYRLLIGQLLLAGTMAACLVYAQNYLLASLTQVLITGSLGSLTSPLLTTVPAREYPPLPAFLQNLPFSLGVSLPLVLLLLFILAHLLSTAFEFLNIYATGELRIKSRTDLEAEVLTHLLGKDDTFFNVHSTSETVNRISLDVFRVCERRCIAMRFWWALVLILGNLIFFFQKEWRLALLAISFCLAAALWTYLMTRGVKHMDKRYLYQDDSVKSRFEDFLRAAPEIQVGSLSGKVRKNFAELQNDRAKTYMRYVKLSGIVQTGNLVSALLALVGAILVVIYAKQTGAGGPTLALFPVVIMSLPTLFSNASQLVTLHIDFQLAHNSIIRLLDYETRRDRHDPYAASWGSTTRGSSQLDSARPVMSVPAPTIRLEGVTYRYPGSHRPGQAGVEDIRAHLVPGQWIAFVGRAGCGKSTLVKLLVGRLQPQEGRILYGDTVIEAFDSRISPLVSFMPQSLALFNATIYENLFLCRLDAPWGPPAANLPSIVDLEIIEGSGVGRLCRLKSLDMTPAEPLLGHAVTDNLVNFRNRGKAFFVRKGLEFLPPGEVYFDRSLWLLEFLLNGKCHRSQALDRFIRRGDCAALRKLDKSELATHLVAWAQNILCDTADRSSFPETPQQYGFPEDEPLGKLRLWCDDLTRKKITPVKARPKLYALALTSSLEQLSGHASQIWGDPASFRNAFSAEIQYLKDLLEGAWQPFKMEEINLHLTWRENLAFGVQGPLPDLLALEFIQAEGLDDFFTRQGLGFNVGRLGGNLSGGQGQLVAICRALLRRTPVLILDEPTSSLDPISKTNVARFLRKWKNGRIVITVSHDPEFIAWADEIILLDDGRIISRGTFSEISKSEDLFRLALRSV